MTSGDEPFYFKEDIPPFIEVLKAVNTLQSNAAVIQQWVNDRHTNKQVDLKELMSDGLARLDLDLSRTSWVHVAGTKGKGSTAAFAESMLRRLGYRTGLYTSPHLVSITERIRLDGRPLSEPLFARHAARVWNRLQATRSAAHPDLPSYFRFLTLMAFDVFLEAGVDVVLCECGVGGRTDATNCLPPGPSTVCTAVTSLGLDHTNVLGETLPEIAFEKAGIFQPGVPCLSAPQPPDARAVLERRARELAGSELITVEPLPADLPFRLGLAGDHQRLNAALAVSCVQTWLLRSPASRHRSASWLAQQQLPWLLPQTVVGAFDQPRTVTVSTPPPLVAGLELCSWPGRCQTVQLPAAAAAADRNNGCAAGPVPLLPSTTTICVHLDGAHTGESVPVSRDWFWSQQLPAAAESANVRGRHAPRAVLLFNCHPSRNPAVLLKPLTSCKFELVVFTNNDTGLTHVLEDQRDPSSTSAAQSSQPGAFQRKLLAVWQTLCSSAAATSSAGPEGAAVPATAAPSPAVVADPPRRSVVCSSVPAAIDEIRQFAAEEPDSDVHVLACGSLYLVGALLEYCSACLGVDVEVSADSSIAPSPAGIVATSEQQGTTSLRN